MPSSIDLLVDSIRSLTNISSITHSSSRGLNFGLGLSRSSKQQQLNQYGSVGTLFSIVSTLANSVSQVDWYLTRKGDGRGSLSIEQKVNVHAALDLWNKPNNFFTRPRFVEGLQQHIDLTGEGWIVVYRDDNTGIPLEMWYVRPDRITPVPHPQEFLSGYLYTTPDGRQKVPLRLDEVIPILMPNPNDPYRGLGPVQSLLSDLDSVRYSSEWNRNFFLNSAEPGGIIEVSTSLGDNEFNKLRKRWNEQHRGISAAHRVAILEHGKWVKSGFSPRDMQFVQLRSVARDIIMEAFGVSKFDLGILDDVNRATAEAAKAAFSITKTTPRLERIKGALNTHLLPMYGSMGKGLEFCYVNPVPPNREQELNELVQKINAWQTLINSGVTPESASQTVGLPFMEIRSNNFIPAPLNGHKKEVV